MSEDKVAHAEKKVKASDHNNYGVSTLVSVLIPVAGIIMGAIYMTKDKKVDRKLGEHLVAVGILASIIVTGLWFALVPGALRTIPNTYVTPSVLDATPIVSTWDIEANYAKVTKGMTREAVEVAIGKTATNCSEVEQSGSTDKYASCTYGDVSDGGIIVINYVNGIVTTTEKATY